MKKLILFIFLLFVSVSCSTTRYIPVNNKEVVNVRDSVVIRDSTVITYLQKEKIKEIAPELDTLVMTTTFAKSTSYLDTTNRVLRGKLEQIDTIPVSVKIVYKDRTVYKDRAVKEEIPVEVKIPQKYIPKWVWYSLGCNLLILLYLLLKLKRVL